MRDDEDALVLTIDCGGGAEVDCDEEDASSDSEAPDTTEIGGIGGGIEDGAFSVACELSARDFDG